MSSGFIGIISLDVRLPSSATLKDRRSALAKIRHGLQERYGAAVAEVGSLDTPSHAQLTAALVHEIGNAIDRANHVAAGLEALGELVTPRTKWLVESLEAAHAHGDNTLGLRARHRLEAHPDFLDALLLAESDRKARVRGYDAPSLDEAIAILRALEQDEE